MTPYGQRWFQEKWESLRGPPAIGPKAPSTGRFGINFPFLVPAPPWLLEAGLTGKPSNSLRFPVAVQAPVRGSRWPHHAVPSRKPRRCSSASRGSCQQRFLHRWRHCLTVPLSGNDGTGARRYGIAFLQGKQRPENRKALEFGTRSSLRRRTRSHPSMHTGRHPPSASPWPSRYRATPECGNVSTVPVCASAGSSQGRTIVAESG